MDLIPLAASVASALAPFIPYLVTAGERATEAAGEKLGAEAWERARELWARLRRPVEARPAAIQAAMDLATAPDDTDALAAFRLQVRKLLEEDPGLRAELGRALESQGATQSVIAAGTRSIAIGGSVTGGNVNAGDQHASPRPAD